MTVADKSDALSVNEQRAGFYEEISRFGLAPLWEVLAELVTPRPTTRARAVRWRMSEISPMIQEACRLISATEAERRVLILENPGLAGESAATSTLYAGLQAILPGEVAPAHRHSQSALRFILQGGGAFTALDGERIMMHRYDLVLTPNWVWHDHGNDSPEPVVWLDGLDIPLIRSLDASFSEHRADRGIHPRRSLEGVWQDRWGSGLRPARILDAEKRANPHYLYTHGIWRRALEAERSSGDPDLHDAYRMEFINPADGGPVLNTMSAFAQLLPAGFATVPVRSSDSSIHIVTEGSGRIQIGQSMFDVAEGDILVVPAWETRRVRADSTGDLVLFSYSDQATQVKLGLWREERL